MLIPRARGGSTLGALVPLHDADTAAPVRVARGERSTA